MNQTNSQRPSRVTAFIPVKVHITGQPSLHGEVENLSQGGAYLRCAFPLQVGAIVKLEFQFSAIRSVFGQVVEVDEIDAKMPLRWMVSSEIRWTKGDYGFGVQFKNIDSTSRRFLSRLVQHFEEMKKDLEALEPDLKKHSY